MPIVLVLGLLVILALRHDDDTDGNRAPAIYASVIAFIGLLTLLFAATGVASSLVSLTADDTSGAIGTGQSDSFTVGTSSGVGEGSSTLGRTISDDDNAAITSAVGFLTAGVAALGLLAVHRRLFARRAAAGGAARRVHRAYLLVLCLTVALIAMVAGGVGLYTLYRAIFPDTAGVDNRADELRSFVTLVVLFVGACGLWRWHWREVDLGEAPEISATAAA